MKISRLYIRNFIVVMSLILASHLLIFILFGIVRDRFEPDNLRDDLSGLALMIRDAAEQKIGKESPSRQDNRAQFEDFLKRLSRSWHAKIWIVRSDGSVEIAGSELRDTGSLEFEKDPLGEIEFHHEPPDMYLRTPVRLRSGNGMLYVVLERSEPRRGTVLFVSGLLIITVIVLVVLLPISRRITNPLKKLTRSVDAISRGEFDLRVDETSSDEIGELGRAFNRMSERVVQMIRGTKELTANISHRIRSPLARMNVAVEILRDAVRAKNPSETERALDTIGREIDEMDLLTGKIIGLIRADIAHVKDDYADVDLSAVLSGAAHSYADLMKSRNIRFTQSIHGSCVIHGIPHDIAELFDILFDNAVKYTPDRGTIDLSVSGEPGKAVVTLGNDFTGPVPANIEEIFEPFARSSSEKIPGYGLGLAIARRIVENHGGTIRAAREEGRFVVRVEIQ